ncbi:sugar phosphate isomerase/epimerase family protein [Marinactinospora rubrisoli]|uniref:Sugar phosphate isomerase/epimerase family protein n=1 Tax=Marinactinospora rubrisoli TaxID=2715399 RepID=A0ABW2KHV2_9ACTN
MTNPAPLSVQLYSVRDALAADTGATLARLAGIGYRAVEPFGLGTPGVPAGERLSRAQELRRSLDAAGLAVSAVHCGLPEDLGALAAEIGALGADTAYIAVPQLVPGFDNTVFGDADRLADFADTLNAAAETLAGSGIRLGYHNHEFEWARLPDGRYGYDVFWSLADERLVAELDVYWATVAGVDPAAVLTRLGPRAVAVHLKDGVAERGRPQTPLGSGDVDVAKAIAAGPGLSWHVAEIDVTELDEFELLATNAKFLVENGLSRWE